jgi:large subunit ribosomal protein L25
MSKIIKLDGNIRTEMGSSATKRLRREGRLPAVIYSNDASKNICIDVDIRAFEKEAESGGITTKIFEINTPKKTFKLVISEVDYDPISDRVRHIDFISLEGKKEVKIFAPIVFLNKDKSPGLKKGGFLNILKRKLHLLCEINSIPDVIEIDIANLRLKQAIRSLETKLPKGVSFVDKKDFMIANITGRGKKDDGDVGQEATAQAQPTKGATSTPAKAASATPAKSGSAPVKAASAPAKAGGKK